MSLFRSEEQRKAERDLEIRRTMKKMSRQVRNLEKDEKGFINKAKRAKQLGDKIQLKFLKANLKRTAATRRMMERQILNMETFNQLKNQAETQAMFAKNIDLIAKMMCDSIGSVNLPEIQKNCEGAINKYEQMEQMMEMMMDTQTESMENVEVGDFDTVISDEEIDRMLDDQIVAEENAEIEDSVASRLDKLKQRMKKIKERE